MRVLKQLHCGFGMGINFQTNILPIENPNTQESKDGFVTIEDFLPETILAFRNILFLAPNPVLERYLTLELLMFTHKYDINSLFRLCKEHICKTLTDENILDFIKIAELLNDEEMFKYAVDYLKKNLGTDRD